MDPLPAGSESHLLVNLDPLPAYLMTRRLANLAGLHHLPNRLGSSSFSSLGTYPSGSLLDDDCQPYNSLATQLESNTVDATLCRSPTMGQERLVPWWLRP